MAFDAHKNFANSQVVAPPSPALSGTSLSVASGDGAKFPTPPFNAVVCPAGLLASVGNAEVVRVTAVATDTFTITRAQESSNARAIIAGDQFYAGPTAKSLTDIEAATGSAGLAVPGLASVPKSVASRCLVNNQNGGISGTTTGETLQQDHLILANCDQVRLAHSNSFGGGRSLPTNSITVTASIIGDDGVIYQAAWGGATSITIPVGKTVLTDPFGVGFRNGDRVLTRTFVSVAVNGNTWPAGAQTRLSPYRDGFLAGDQTMVASPAFTTDGNFHYGPAAVMADVTDAPCVIVINGDSISAGQNDTNSNMDQQGWVTRALNNGWPYLNLSIAGDSAEAFQPQASGQASSRAPRMRLQPGATHAICALGTNDGGANLAQIQSAILAVWSNEKMYGQKAIATTIMPHGVTSSDGFATLVNQTVPANDAVRAAYNVWIRGGAPIDPTALTAVAVGTSGALVFGSTGHPATGYVDPCAAVESSTGSGKWRVDQGQISDGTHPNATGDGLIVTAIQAPLTALLGPKAPGATQPQPPLTPATIFGSSLFAWYPISAITGLSNGASVASWPDSSGNTRPLLQATGANKPIYTTGVNYSLPAVRFDGITQFLQTAGFGTLAQPYEIWLVFKNNYTGATGAKRFLGGQGGSTLNASWNGNNTTAQPVALGTTASFQTGFIQDPSAAWHAWGFLLNNTTSAIYEDLTTPASGTGGTASISALAVGADSNGSVPSQIDVQEVLILNRASTGGERTSLRSYFQQTYGTP